MHAAVTAHGDNGFFKVKSLFRIGVIKEVNDLIRAVDKSLFVNAAKGIGKRILLYPCLGKQLLCKRCKTLIMGVMIAISNRKSEQVNLTLAVAVLLHRRTAVAPGCHRLAAFVTVEGSVRTNAHKLTVNLDKLLSHHASLGHSCGKERLAGNVVRLHPGVHPAHTKALVCKDRTAARYERLQMGHDLRIKHGIVGEVQHLVFCKLLGAGCTDVIHGVIAVAQQTVHARMRVAIVELRICKLKGEVRAAGVLNLGKQHGIKVKHDGDLGILDLGTRQILHIFLKIRAEIANSLQHGARAAVHTDKSRAILLVAKSFSSVLPIHHALCTACQGSIGLELHVKGGVILVLEHAKSGIDLVNEIILVYRTKKIVQHHEIKALLVRAHLGVARNAGSPEIHRL